MTKFSPHTALKLIASGKLTFDERVVVHRVACVMHRDASPPPRTQCLALSPSFGAHNLLGPPTWRAWAPFCSKVDGFVQHTQLVNFITAGPE